MTGEKQQFDPEDLDNWPDPNDYNMLEWPVPPHGKPLGDCTKEDLQVSAEFHRQRGEANQRFADVMRFLNPDTHKANES